MALGEAESYITPLINVVDPNKKTHTSLHNILLGLVVLAITIPAPELAPEVAAAATAAQKITNIVLKGIKAAPGVGLAMFPEGTESSQDFQVAALTSAFSSPGGITDSLTIRLQNVLQIVQGYQQPNVSSFLGFASGGSFSAPLSSRPSFAGPIYQDIIRAALKTYLASIALADNGWHILMLPGVDPLGITNGTAKCPSWAGSDCEENRDLGCNLYQPSGQCNNYWWYSTIQDSAFTLSREDDTDSTNIIQSLLNLSVITGPLFFENAAICEVEFAMRQFLPNSHHVVYNGQSGFFEIGANIGGLQSPNVVDLSNGTIFLPINGGGLSALSEDKSFSTFLYHPNNGSENTVWQDFGPNGYDFSCLSQLNVTIANSWPYPWNKNSP